MGNSLLRLSVLLVSACLPIFAQGTTSRVIGTVVDPTGAAVAGAAVTLTNEGTGTAFTTTSATQGTYVFEAVQPGQYSVAVEAKGFRKFISRQNPVTIGQPATINASLEVGSLTETIDVVASAETVQTSTSGNFGNLLPEQVIKDLPVVGSRGRNPLDLVLLQPGVVSGSNTGGGTHINGARDRAWNFTIDGIDANETSAGGSLFTPIRTNPDSLAEFRVITANATAEYGRSSGAQVSLITKSGTNEFHGKGFWFYRTPRLTANEWENNINARGKRQFVQNIWGGDLGGPLIKNKTFFYGNLQKLRTRETSLTSRTVFTESARQGILRYNRSGRNNPAGVSGAAVDASGNVLPGVQIGSYSVVNSDPERIGFDKRIQGLMQQVPLPNNFFGGDGLNTAFYTFPAKTAEKQYDTTLKFDHIFNEKNAAYARISFGRQDTTCDAGNGGQELFPGRGCVVNTERNPKNLAFNWRWNPVAAITNEMVVGLNKFKFNFGQPFANLGEYALSTPVTLIESTEYGNTRQLQTWQFVDNLAWQRGSHAFKFGTNLRFQQHLDWRGSVASLNASPLLDFSTSVNNVDPQRFGIPSDLNVSNDLPSFASWINLMLGRVGNRRQGFVSDGSAYKTGLFQFDARYYEYDFYVQDTWKVHKNLTVDLGLRWEPRMSPSSPNGITAPDQIAVNGAAPSNTLRWVPGQLFKDNWKNLGPSMGFAWDPFGTGKTSIRSNYRIAYDRIPTFLASSFIFPAVPGATTAISDQEYGRLGGRLASVPKLTPPTQSPSAAAQPAAASANSNSIFDPNLKFPTTHQWAFSIQREVLSKTVFEVSYLGRRAYHLFGGYNANQPEIFRNGFANEFATVKNGGESALINRLASADSRLRTGETPSQMYRRLFPADFTNNAVATLANRIATQLQGGVPVTQLSGAGPFALINYPQYNAGLFVVDSNDFSTYHGLQFQLERRYSNGFTGQISYVFSKSLDTRSYDPNFTLAASGTSQTAANSPFDVNNRKLNYARSDFDRTHIVQSNFVYELPFGKGKRFGGSASGPIGRIIGGWQLGGIIRVSSGRPMTVFSGYNTFNVGVSSTVDCNGCNRSFGTVHQEDGLVWYFTPEERAKMSNPAAGSMGNTGRNYFSGPGSFNMDATLLKRTRITERVNFELRADATNFTNTPTFSFPTLTFSSSTFGRIRDSIYSNSRRIQVGAKITF